MEKSPGHQKWPEHQISEQRADRVFRVELDGEVLAQSEDVIQLEEEGHLPRYYFPRSDVRMDKLRRSETVTECPFKGRAHYYAIAVDGHTLPDAAWTYEDPYLEHHDLRGRIAFYDDKFHDLRVLAVDAR